MANLGSRDNSSKGRLLQMPPVSPKPSRETLKSASAQPQSAPARRGTFMKGGTQCLKRA